MGKKTEVTKEELFKRVEIVPESGCWLWTRAVIPKGYGRWGVSHTKQLLAHRISYELYRGSVPEGLNVLHSCDVPCCVNPKHLFLGTQKDNARDMVSKNRHNLERKRDEITGRFLRG